MIHVEQHGPVTVVRMARSLFGRPIYWTAAYLVDGLLIDSGPPCTAQELAQCLADADVKQIVVTHAHEDHIGGLARLQQRYPEVEIYASRGAVQRIADPSSLKIQLYRRALWGRPKPVRKIRSLDEANDVIATPSHMFRVVETPGHSPAHISLFEPVQRWVFCGDAFIGGRDRAWSRDYDLFGVVSSLRTLAALRPERLFPGSGHIRRTPLPDLHAKIGFYTRLAEQVAEREAAGATVAEMASELLGRETSLRYWTLGHFSSANLIEACREYNNLIGPSEAAGTAATAPDLAGARQDAAQGATEDTPRST